MNMLKKTKIVATIGPSSDSEEKIEELIKAGVNVFRFNMKHNIHAWHEERINRVRSISAKLGVVVGVFIDLQGPEIRIETRDKKEIVLAKGEKVVFANSFDDPQVSIKLSHQNILSALHVGDEILIDDGFIELDVVDDKNGQIVAQTRVDTAIKDHKGLNLPGKDIDVPSLTDDDKDKLDLAARVGADFLGLSFVRTKEDLDILHEEMAKRKLTAQVVSKIENQKALDHIDELIENSDAVMVARGDLGVEVPMEQLAFWQTQMIEKCRTLNKPVIVATQMLQSMVDNPRPTRAEVTDVANAILEGTDAIMLSGESASGKYPVRAVEMMTRIAQYNEDRVHSHDLPKGAQNTTDLIAKGGFEILKFARKNLALDAIVIFTETGKTVNVFSSFRPHLPIVGVTHNEETLGRMALSYGVVPVFEEFPEGEVKNAEELLVNLVDKGILSKGQTVMVVHGQLWKRSGLTNSLSIVTV